MTMKLIAKTYYGPLSNNMGTWEIIGGILKDSNEQIIAICQPENMCKCGWEMKPVTRCYCLAGRRAIKALEVNCFPGNRLEVIKGWLEHHPEAFYSFFRSP